MTMTKTLAALAVLTFSGALVSPTWAGHSRSYRTKHLRETAHDLERAAHTLHKAAERRRHHYDRGEARALRHLHELDKRARHFHKQIERRHTNPYHVAKDYRRLRKAYYRASNSVHRLHATRRVQRRFHKVAWLIERLDAYYGRYDDRGYRHGRGSYGNGYDHDRAYRRH